MDKIILTASYENCKLDNKILPGVIALNQDAKNNGKCADYITSKLSSINVTYEENSKLYIKEFYTKVLKPLDPEEVLLELPNKSILLDSKNNINRHLIAYWLELFMEIKTYEIKVALENNKLLILNRPEHLKDELEQVIKENYDMSSFHSIRAAYLFNQSSELERVFEEQAEVWLKEVGSIPSSGSSPCEIMTEAAGLRVEADEIEAEYIKRKKYPK